MELSINTSAAVLGLGYIIGLKYSLIICAGSFFIWFFVVPLLGQYGAPEVAQLTTTEIFLNYGRFIGVGAIAMAGIIGIIKSWGVIKGAAGLAAKELGGKGKAVAEALPRTERDLSMKLILISIVSALVIVFVFFYFGVIHNLMQTVVAFLVVLIIAFLFTTVAANAIAIVGSNPVSGMTLMTLIVASMVLVSVGLEGTSGMVASMVIPFQVLMIPLVSLYGGILNLLSHRATLIFMHVGFSLSMATFMFHGAINTNVPIALEEAAKIDGCTRWQTFWKVTLPLCKPMVVYQIITAFMGPWMDFIFAKIIVRAEIKYATVSIGMWKMLEMEFINGWFTRFCAAAVLVSIPIAVLFMITQKFYQEAMGGAVKG